MIFSAANRASDSDTKSSGVTKLDVILPRMKLPGCRLGVMAARQCLGSHESRESKRGKVQSCIALTDWRHEELTLLRSERRRGIALVHSARLADRSWLLEREPIDEP